MQVQQLMIVWSFKLLLAGAQDRTITYLFTRTCAVEGSTVLLPCSFTPLKSFIIDGINVPLKIIRVRWCRNHPICQGDTPSVFDSDSLDVDPQFQYLGDMEGKCTLQISNIQLKDEATYRFRMEANDSAGHFTNPTGVMVQVEGNPVMRVTGSNNSEVREGQAVSLQCSTSPCSFHRVNISWFRDDHALPEAGPTLHLGPLTAKDSGNYSCALGTRTQSRSDPFSLQVEADSEGETSHRILGVAVAVLVVVIALAALVLFLVIKRRRSAVSRSAEQRHRGDVVLPSGPNGEAQRTDLNVEDVSYAAVHFKQKKPSRELQPHADDVVYSAVVTRG